MAFRRRRTFVPFRRRRAKWMWAREVVHNVGPANPNSSGLLNPWRANMGLVFNLPDIVIWRVHIKISISIHLSSATYNSDAGVRIGMYVDDVVQTQLAAGPTSNQYG